MGRPRLYREKMQLVNLLFPADELKRYTYLAHDLRIPRTHLFRNALHEYAVKIEPHLLKTLRQRQRAFASNKRA
jgi:hypothetical protein